MMEGRTRIRYERTPGFLDRVGGSCVGILVGGVLLIIATWLLFWNEGRAVQTAKSLDEGLSMVVPLGNPEVVSAENNGKLIHLTGPLKTFKVLNDPVYNVAINAVKLKRTVEMYQWIEHSHEKKYDEGNGQTRVETTYTYSQEWRSSIVSSQGFDDAFYHKNPSSMPLQSATYESDEVQVGGFFLSKGLISKVANFKILMARDTNGLTDKNVQIHNGMYYHGIDPMRPQTGDVRVKFEYAGLGQQSQLGSPDVVSIVARQFGAKLLPYRTIAGDDLEMLYIGQMSAETIFNKEKLNNSMMTWGIRFGGWLLMFIGFSALTSIIPTLVGWIPFVRDLVAMGVCLMNMGFAISLSLTVIAVGWIYYRPLLGLTILALSLTPYLLAQFRQNGGYSRSRVD